MRHALIEPQTLQARLGDPAWAVVDCQYDLADAGAGRRAYLAGHLPGAVHADLGADLSGPPATDCGRHPVPAPAVLEARFSALGLDNDKRVAAYDASGGAFAARLWWLLRYAGHERVAVLNGGLAAWKRAEFELETGPGATPGGARFKASIDARALVKLDEAISLSRGGGRLIDSREPARYAGQSEPIDPVAGHIPGAVNHYWKNNLDEQGRFLPPERLREGLRAAYAGARPEEAAFYCGSGVTACHNLLAAVCAGHPMPRLYAGSWSEWCSDPTRPIAPPRPGVRAAE